MKKSLNFLAICTMAVITFSCEKQENFRTNNSNNGNDQEKTIKNTPPSTLVLVPSSSRPRIAFLPDGDDFLGVTPYDVTSLRDGIFSSMGATT
ncbi:hypothetical protein [Fluviicola chungangensis]|uniref:Uncharacterized protein n=1 Tax=Fluviicola chungangensis TaxID=2597671 RepID=A0A556MZP4_9FLAO|nr:hypothetical protein [Fluviicola chungangensis]TSJ45402.1 hypothetical protein FO442_06520 [Fluviicola chungangensis]